MSKIKTDDGDRNLFQRLGYWAAESSFTMGGRSRQTSGIIDTCDAEMIRSAFTQSARFDFSGAARFAGVEFPVLEGRDEIVEALITSTFGVPSRRPECYTLQGAICRLARRETRVVTRQAAPPHGS